jgi:transcriptional regulator NrdR family protein
MHALQKRPVTQEQIETVLSDIQLQIRRLGERDVKSEPLVKLSCNLYLHLIMLPMFVLPRFIKISRC